jgi:hypothetical protein
MRRLLLVSIVLAAAGCKDLTEPLPAVEGRYDYSVVGPASLGLNRQGTIEILDANRRTASFEGTFDYTNTSGRVTGKLVGAFVTPNRVWFHFFHFLNEPGVYHEGDLGGITGFGDVYFKSLTYEPSGASYALRRR